MMCAGHDLVGTTLLKSLSVLSFGSVSLVVFKVCKHEGSVWSNDRSHSLGELAGFLTDQ